ncbi:MAG TPA: T9SS type A sorting domain-containing protein [Lentimicrobium sp.]|nr:T9SS type A sorting domain-containing protein [Lentimicrobium sp.]
MKKLALLILLITSFVSVYCQSQRLVMLEHFTQASCGPCASANPTIHNILVNNPNLMTSINYHTSWPGYDPMYNHNPTDPSTRVSYYGVNAVPHSVIDGNVYSGLPNGWTGNMSIVNNRAAVPSPFTLTINQHLSAANDTLFVTMLVECTMPVTGPVSAFMGVIEKYIHFNTAPGSNGEKDFYNVLKKMLPTKSGISLPTPMNPGDYAIIESYWVLANVYNLDQLSVVSFIQNPTSKEVYQAANLSLTPMQAVYDNDVEESVLVDVLDHYCYNSFVPKVKIRNNGNSALTSLAIKYQVNDEDIQTYNWTGNLPFLGKSTIQLPELSFQMQDTNVLKIYVDQVNQTADEYTQNDTIIHTFYNAIEAGHAIQLKIRTDNSPQEITWSIIDDNGVTVASGGPYTDPMTMYTENISLDNEGCYEFYIYDTGGNGLCCGNGTGFFKLSPASGNPVIAQGTIFEYQMAAQFEVVNVGIHSPEITNDLKLYPNPAGNKFWIEVPKDNKKYTVSVVNQLGQKVFTSIETGDKTEVDTEDWPMGIYVVMLESDNNIKVQKISISR